MAYKDLDKKRANEKAWTLANPEKVKEAQKKYRETHREEHSKRSSEWNKEHRAIVTKRAQACHFKKFYGITINEKFQILADQDGRCAVCGSGELDKIGPWCIDHNHESGKIRGVLCRRCNMMLGSIGDNPAILRNMIAYLIRAQGGE